MTIVADDNIPLLAPALESCGNVLPFSGRSLTNSFLRESGCEALFVRSTTRVDAGLLEGTRVRFVATATAGSDHVDRDFLRNEGIGFFAAEGSNSNAVAEYAVFAILHRAVQQSGTRDPDEFLRQKTIGIVGFGHVGRKLAYYAQRLGLGVLVNDPPLRKKGFEFPAGLSYAGLDEICSSCDIVSNHVPFAADGEFPTKGLFSQRQISLLKNNALLIHASRGGVLDENALLDELKKKRISAVIDVWENEPDADPELAALAMMATPHIAGHTRNAKLNGTRMVAEEFARRSGCAITLPVMESPFPPFEWDSAAELYRLLRERRMLAEDSEEFKAKISVQGKRFFDEFRRNYPPRYETLQADNGI